MVLFWLTLDHPELPKTTPFLAKVSRSLYAVARPSVVRLSSVTFVHPTELVEIFGNVSSLFGTLAIRWHPRKILRRLSQGNPSVGGLNARGVARYSDFAAIEGSISAAVQDWRSRFESRRRCWIFSLDFLFLINNWHKHIYIKIIKISNCHLSGTPVENALFEAIL